MLPMTKKFLIKVHEAFDELGYHPKDGGLSYEELCKASINTLVHSKELIDSINCGRMFYFLNKKYDKIERTINSHLDFWKSMPYEGNELISLVDDVEAVGNYYITNAFADNEKDIFIFTKDTFWQIIYKSGKYHFNDEECKYYLRHSKMSSSKMVLLDNKGNKLCVIVLSENYNIFLENNNTDYTIVLYDIGMGIYDKKYINSLRKDERIDANQCKAFIEWDILSKDNDRAMSRLEYYDENSDFELFLMFATACFLVFKEYIKSNNSSFVRTAMLTSAWRRR